MKLLLTVAISSFVALAACDSANPFMTDTGTGTGGVVDDDGLPVGVDGDPPSPNTNLVRYEEANDNGGGRAEDFAYDAVTDTFTVDNLAFDGEGPYTRGAAVPNLGPNGAYLVYDAEVVVPDFADNQPITQIVPYRAVIGISTNVVGTEPRTAFAIVRTGGYSDFGFGGFVYQREGGVTIPTSGQARFEGDYAGVRVFDGVGGLEYVEADMTIDLDFDDPTDAIAGVKGRVFNRVAYDINGNVVASTGPGQVTPENVLPLPNISFVIDGDNGNLSIDGELNGDIATNIYFDENGDPVDYESGTYYGILAGDAATTDSEIVGVLVIDSTDPRFDNVTVQETGGFILYR